LLKDRNGRLLYVGKAANLRRRVSAYFLGKSHKSGEMTARIGKVDFQPTETALEALILEAQLIKKFQPPYNVREADDRSFLYVEITREKFPRVILVRGRSVPQGRRFGPFVSASAIRQALKIIRRIFPFSIHPADKIGRFSRPCFDREIGLCPGTCVGAISSADYRRNIRGVRMILSGKKKKLLVDLEKEMRRTSSRLDFEEAENIRRQIFGLRHIQDVALLSEENQERKTEQRIEGYDISNISGRSATGSLAVFIGGKPAKNEYRLFKIRTFDTPNDIAMLREILRRRFRNNWPLPVLILVDGGEGQVRAATEEVSEAGLNIPVVGLAKGPTRKADRLVGSQPEGINRWLLLALRDEAHRFALRYHKKLRSVNLLK